MFHRHTSHTHALPVLLAGSLVPFDTSIPRRSLLLPLLEIDDMCTYLDAMFIRHRDALADTEYVDKYYSSFDQMMVLGGWTLVSKDYFPFALALMAKTHAHTNERSCCNKCHRRCAREVPGGGDEKTQRRHGPVVGIPLSVLWPPWFEHRTKSCHFHKRPADLKNDGGWLPPWSAPSFFIPLASSRTGRSGFWSRVSSATRSSWRKAQEELLRSKKA